MPVRDMEFSAGVIWGFDLNLIDFNEGRPARDRSQFVWAGKEPWVDPHSPGFRLLVQ